jgi:hypothetical protein
MKTPMNPRIAKFMENRSKADENIQYAEKLVQYSEIWIETDDEHTADTGERRNEIGGVIFVTYYFDCRNGDPRYFIHKCETRESIGWVLGDPAHPLSIGVTTTPVGTDWFTPYSEAVNEIHEEWN